MQKPDPKFITRARAALEDSALRGALDKVEDGFVGKRNKAINEVGKELFDLMRQRAQQAKQHGLANLSTVLEKFEQAAIQRGSKVHWVSDADSCNQRVLEILRRANCRRVNKGKSMVTEEIGLNQVLSDAGLVRTETDLGEYIIQLADEPPSHIIAPAVHKNIDQISELFRQHHTHLPATRKIDSPRELVGEARGELREKYLNADAGIIGSNLLIAENGSSMLVTNEGNGDLTVNLPRVLIVVAGIEKVVDTMRDAFAVIRVLGRSATGQAISNYTSFYSGPSSKGEVDGPEEVHFLLLDNGRSKMMSEGFADMLRCIRCGACLSHCPIYSAIGGHAYGWVYPGPMGSVLTPLLVGMDKHASLPNASTFCGRCEEVCPVNIPLPEMLRKLRVREFDQGHGSRLARCLVKAHSWLIVRPKLNHLVNRFSIRCMRLIARNGTLPTWVNPPGWRKTRVIAAAQGRTMSQLAQAIAADGKYE